jgi:phosphotransferase family enzyme
MSAAAQLLGRSLPTSVSSGVQQLAVLPDWLTAALQPKRVAEALGRHVPEFATGELKLRGCKVRRLILKDTSGRWAGTYNLTVEGPAPGQQRAVALRGTLTAPTVDRQAPAAAAGEPRPFGSEGWSVYLPELHLDLEIEPPETVLGALPQLTEAEESRALLERSIGAGMPAYQGLRLRACTPQIISYKPGSRCTIMYHLEYPAELAAGRGWPTTVIAKTYRGKKGQIAYDGMLALWRSPLSAGDVVTIAEPLAYVPELKLLVQGPIPAEQSLEDLLKLALVAGTPEALEDLRHYMRMSARGLAALHRSGVHPGETMTWQEWLPDVHDLIERLVVPLPALAHAVTPLVARLEAIAAEHPPDPPVPTHGTFDPEQVLIAQGRIGFIDFDSFCLAEPAMDIGLFLAAIMDSGIKAGDEVLDSREARLARLDQLRAIGEVFLAEYESLAPVSRQRVALWEAIDFLLDALHAWTKAKPAGPDNDLLILEHHLRGMGIW